MEQPKRIVAEPTRRSRKNTKGKTVVVSVFKCDNGRSYTMSALAETVGISTDTIRTRLAAYGWKSPYILVPPAKPGHTPDGKTVNSDAGANAEWQGLSNRVRNNNLAKIRKPGLFELGL